MLEQLPSTRGMGLVKAGFLTLSWKAAFHQQWSVAVSHFTCDTGPYKVSDFMLKLETRPGNRHHLKNQPCVYALVFIQN